MDLKKKLYICGMNETITYKTCTKCGVEKPLDDYYKSKKCLYGRMSYCKVCQKKQSKNYYNSNKDKKRIYVINNFEKIKEYNKNYKLTYDIDEYQKKYRKFRYNTDSLFKIKITVRNTINRFIDDKNIKTNEILSCDWETLKNHIESQFTEDMTWDNHGLKGWHLDHIIPLSSAKTEEDVYRLNHYTNFQPLWWEDNLRKSDKISEEWGNDYNPNHHSI
jgi:hypothetical protein